MAGRISDKDIAQVRDVMTIEKVVGDYVQLKPAGGGSLKGLCPFHDERSPSFNVSTVKGFYHCFGCGKGGDAIDFIREMEHLEFSDAIELLARKAGLTLTYEGGGSSVRGQRGQRERLATANLEAQRWMAEQLTANAESATGRTFLSDRGFDRAAAERFGVGYAPKGWELMCQHLLSAGFTRDELTASGLATTTSRGTIIDRFRGRLVWPIRDLAGDIVGFGARKLYDDDTGAKYLNTPETPLFKKSKLLYGLDLAKGEIAKAKQAVVVEGYTDVMACHLAGIPTAVATCGTSFGEEHVGVLRRLLLDADEFKGEVIFTFDGDAAGQKAAVRAGSLDARFTLNTYVAVARDGLDPCDLRLRHGDQAVRDLIKDRVPLYEFVIKAALVGYDLDTDEGRLAALGQCLPLLDGIKDDQLRMLYAERAAGWLGFPDVAPVRSRVRAPMAQRSRSASPSPAAAAAPRPVQSVAGGVERDALKLAMQHPDAAAAAGHDQLEMEWFTEADHARVHLAIILAGGTATAAEGDWVGRVSECAEDDPTRNLVRALAVEPLRTQGLAADPGRYAVAVVRRVEELSVERRLRFLKARLQREPTDELFVELMKLEQRRREVVPDS